MKSRTLTVAGSRYSACGVPELLHVALTHDSDPIRDAERFDLVVGDQEDRHAEAALQDFQLGAHLTAQLGVQVAEGLVEEQDLRFEHQAAREGDALLLAAAELGRRTLGKCHPVRPARGHAGRVWSAARRPGHARASGYATFSNTFMCGQMA